MKVRRLQACRFVLVVAPRCGEILMPEADIAPVVVTCPFHAVQTGPQFCTGYVCMYVRIMYVQITIKYNTYVLYVQVCTDYSVQITSSHFQGITPMRWRLFRVSCRAASGRLRLQVFASCSL